MLRDLKMGHTLLCQQGSLVALVTVFACPLQAYAERQRAHAPKPIDRRKLEPRIGDYIRDTVKVLIDKRDTM